MIRFNPLPLMTLFAVLALALLLMLGRWQWERYQQKTRLAHQAVPEMTIENYQPVGDGMQFVSAPRDGEWGWRVFTPVQTGDAIIFVDSDFIAGTTPPNWREVRPPPALRYGAPIRGASMRAEPAGAFTPPARPLERIWFNVDLAAMGRAAGLDNVADYYIAAPYVRADGRAAPNPFAHAPGADPLPPARHLGYALTWWGLAVVLVGVYFAYHVSAGRLGWASPAHDDD
ncbi:MAG TPA: SURF1 family protein [Caulobacterales bacterium]|nr:SURF1 family protein [Caulobacterales bacterium]